MEYQDVFFERHVPGCDDDYRGGHGGAAHAGCRGPGDFRHGRPLDEPRVPIRADLREDPPRMGPGTEKTDENRKP